ncbi:NAD(P)-dependent oxidoreductase [Candidatus Pacearchaeota archaeon]|nr:NAD(P)-dependent oxidoreductase [Candidatus Pacearchaeota archaeon]
MKKILVTGSNGFVGTHLLKSLYEGGDKKVYTLSRSGGGYNHFSSDILKFNKYGDYDVIYHLAAAIYPSECERDPYHAWLVNAEGTRHIASHLSKGQHLIYPSTSHVYDYSTNKKFISEDAPLHPSNVYGLTKLLGEKSIKDLSDRQGFSNTILRIFHAYGPGQKEGQLITDVIKKITEQNEIVIRGSNNYISPVYIDDLVEVLTNNQIPPEVYNVCGNCISVEEIYRVIGAMVGNSNILSDPTPSDKKYMCGNREKISQYKKNWFSLEEGVSRIMNMKKY